MTAKNGLLGLVVGAAFGAGGMYWMMQHAAPPAQTETSIVLPDKVFTDTGGAAYPVVTIQGRWAGEGIGYKNNAVTVMCVKNDDECWVAGVDQIGVNQVSLDLYSLPLTGWSDNLITASDGEVSCARTTLNISRRNKSAEWVQEPINQSRIDCEKAANQTYKWHLEGSLLWDAIRATTAASK
jgi:hypothetical protein